MNAMTSGHKAAQLDQLMSAVALTATLAACGGGGSAPTPSPAPTPVAAPTPTPAPTLSAGDLSSTVQVTTFAAGSHQQIAYTALNTARLQGGFGTVAQNAALDSEAQNQADFIEANYTVASGAGGKNFDGTALTALQPDGNETGHVQLSTLPGYTGYLPADRAQHFGYPSTNVSESATWSAWSTEAGTQCINLLLSSPGHRELLLDPRFRDIGLGFDSVAWDSSGTIFSYDCYIATAAESDAYASTGMATAPSAWVGIFPADGSTVFSTGDSHGHGFAPSVTVDSHLTLSVSSFTITDAAGQTVATTLNADALTSSQFQNWAFATPTAVLQMNTTYTVNFQGAASGTAITKTWKFTTPAS